MPTLSPEPNDSIGIGKCQGPSILSGVKPFLAQYLMSKFLLCKYLVAAKVRDQHIWDIKGCSQMRKR